MIELAPATAADAVALVELWNAAFGADFPMTERLLQQTVAADPYYEPAGSLVARTAGADKTGEAAAGLRWGDIVGWVLCKSMRGAGPEMGRFQGRGGIGALCVHPAYQRQGIGTRLLDHAEAYLRDHGSPVTTLYFPHHFLPGVPAGCEAALQMLRRRGYSGYTECVDLWRDLRDYRLPDRVQRALRDNPQVALRPAREDEAPALITMVEREFPGGWTYSTRRHFRDGGAAADIIVAVERDAVIGFCHTADWRSRWLLPSTYWHPLLGERYGGLGPVGMARQHRKRGLGLALTAVAVADLQRRGVQRMAIDWTNLVAFYEQLGFVVWKRYLQAELKIW